MERYCAFRDDATRRTLTGVPELQRRSKLFPGNRSAFGLISITVGAYGRYGGTALRPGFADRRFRRTLRNSRSVPFLRVEASRIRRGHRIFVHSLRLASSNTITCSTLPVESRMRISPVRSRARVSA
jgi:hypothetical protein